MIHRLLGPTWHNHQWVNRCNAPSVTLRGSGVDPQDLLRLQERVLLPADPRARVLFGRLQEASIEVAQASGESPAVPSDMRELRPELHGRDVDG